MCLAVPMKVVEIAGPVGRVEARGVAREVRMDLVEDVKVGDYVIVHAGIAIERLQRQEAEEGLSLFEEILGHVSRRSDKPVS